MKKLMIIFLVVFSVLFTVETYATSTTYANIITDEDGDPTGQTIEYELEWISQDTLQVTVTTRATTSGDGLYLYNLTSNTPTVSDSVFSISGGTNFKTLPFGGSAISATI